jgi:Flp pilus assembly protein TadD
MMKRKNWVSFGSGGNAMDDETTELSKAVTANPDDAAAYSDRAMAYARKGDFDHALEDLEQALRLEPDNKDQAAADNREQAATESR